jgi:hypothetical protein
VKRWILPLCLLAPLLTAQAALGVTKDARATAVVGQFLQAYQHANKFSAKMDVLTCQGKEQSHMAVEMTYAKPRNVALTVLDAPQFPAARGTTLTWLGEAKARVSTHFYGLPLAVTLPVDDPRIFWRTRPLNFVRWVPPRPKVARQTASTSARPNCCEASNAR